MPRNTTGGSGHKAQRNSESSKARNNREFVDALLDDYADKMVIYDVFVGRVLKRMGSGRMEVFYVNHTTTPPSPTTQIVPMRGGLRGKGKRDVWVDIDAIVMIAETGLSGTTHEIVAVFTPQQVARYKKLCPDADPRLFQRSGNADESAGAELFEFEGGDEDIDVDAI
jgi:hypothetical protein